MELDTARVARIGRALASPVEWFRMTVPVSDGEGHADGPRRRKGVWRSTRKSVPPKP
jgi:hypothetical protein